MRGGGGVRKEMKFWTPRFYDCTHTFLTGAKYSICYDFGWWTKTYLVLYTRTGTLLILVLTLGITVELDCFVLQVCT